jgi:hypothetical protein
MRWLGESIVHGQLLAFGAPRAAAGSTHPIAG